MCRTYIHSDPTVSVLHGRHSSSHSNSDPWNNACSQLYSPCFIACFFSPSKPAIIKLYSYTSLSSCMFMSRHQNAKQNLDTVIANKSTKNMWNGSDVWGNKNCIKITSTNKLRKQYGECLLHYVENFLLSCLVFKILYINFMGQIRLLPFGPTFHDVTQ